MANGSGARVLITAKPTGSRPPTGTGTKEAGGAGARGTTRQCRFRERSRRAGVLLHHEERNPRSAARWRPFGIVQPVGKAVLLAFPSPFTPTALGNPHWGHPSPTPPDSCSATDRFNMVLSRRRVGPSLRGRSHARSSSPSIDLALST